MQLRSGFQGQIAIVTGVGSGIGRSTARLLAGDGTSVLFVDINQAAVGVAVAEIRAEARSLLVRSSRRSCLSIYRR